MQQGISTYTETIGNEIVDIAFCIYRQWGLGLLESVYEKCFCFESAKRSLLFERQKVIPIVYDEYEIEDGLRIDILVENEIIVELKAPENVHPVWEAQLLNYLRLTNKRLGFLIKFHVPFLKNGIKRVIL